MAGGGEGVGLMADGAGGGGGAVGSGVGGVGAFIAAAALAGRTDPSFVIAIAGVVAGIATAIADAVYEGAEAVISIAADMTADADAVRIGTLAILI